MKKFCLAVAALLSIGRVSTAQPCTPQFVGGYDYGTLVTSYQNSVNRVIESAVYFDDHSGTGPALFIAGSGITVPGAGVTRLAKFANGRWNAIPDFVGAIHAMTVFDFGSGPRLFVAGDLVTIPGGQSCNGVAAWDGTAWTPVGTTAMSVRSLLGAQTPAGPRLFAGGTLPAPSTAPALRQWDGTAWNSVGTPAPGGPASNNGETGVRALAYFDDGSGPKLYAGGTIYWDVPRTQFGAAAWDGTAWTFIPGLSGAVGSTSGELRCFAVQNDPDGPHLYAGGVLISAADTSTQQLARLVNGAWQLSTGTYDTLTQAASAIVSVDEPGGPSMYAAVGSSPRNASQMRKYRNGAWTNLDIAFTTVDHNSSFVGVEVLAKQLGTGRVLALGNFGNAGSTKAASAASWNGGAWEAVEPVGLGGIFGTVSSTPEVNEDTVYVGGRRFVSGVELPSDLPNISPTSFVRLHQTPEARVIMNSIGESRMDNGSGWLPLPTVPGVNSDTKLCVSMDTGIETLVAANRTAAYRYVAGAWIRIATNFGQLSNTTVTAVAGYNGGTGNSLYVAGRTVSNVPMLLSLVGSQWQSVPVSGLVNALTVFDLGAGPELVIALSPSTLGDPAGLYAWNGTSMRQANAGLPVNTYVSALRVMDVGRGPKLWCAASTGLYFWDGAAWQTSPDWAVNASSMGLLHNPDGTRSIFLSGAFNTAGATISNHIAELKFCLPNCTADINHDGDSGTDADIEAFFACLAGNCCPTCTSADFNGDGTIGTDADIESFFRVLAGGSC